MKTLVTFFIGLIAWHGTFCLQAQQANIWYFHQKAGLDFNTTPPSVLTNGAILTPTSSPGQEGEGVASICDNSGSLLFYTDGVTVYNRNHLAMPSGNGLMGHPSSAQSAIVVPKPGSTTLYYLITAPLTNTTDGIRYSEIDMTLNGGLGDVVAGQKNILLGTASRMMEGIAAVPHDNGTDYWLITHEGAGSNTFKIFRITPGGIALSATTALGYTVPSSGSDIGLFKSNSCYSQIAVAYHSSDVVGLFDFNNATGAISNARALSNFTGGDGVYGLEFSPNGRYLYVTGLYNKVLYQFDISSGVAATIDATRTTIGSAATGADRLAALQLGPDGKIYAANHAWGPYNSNAGTYTYLGTISSPDVAGAGCNWVNNAIAIPSVDGPSGYYSGVKHGLPTLLKSLVANALDILSSDACLQQAVNFSYTFTGGVSSVSWDFGDPASGAANSSSSSTPTHTYTTTGNYTVTLTLTDLCGKTHVQTEILHVTDTRPAVNWTCSGSTITLTGTSPGTGNTGYLWYGGSGYSQFLSNTNTATSTGSPASFMVYGTNASASSSASYTGFGEGYPQANNYVEFNANSPFNINTIQVKAENGAGGCNGASAVATFTLRQGATVISTKNVTINCGAGIQTLTLNMGVPVANGLRLESNIGFYYVATYQAGSFPWQSNPALSYVSASHGTNGPFANWTLGLPAACSARRVDVDCALPVDLVYFRGHISGNSSLLYWNTASEENNKLFVIERSSDGIRFESIGEVEGRGTAKGLRQYDFTDNKPLGGMNYYRLKQVDIDGTYTYSSILRLHFDSAEDLFIYPNPSEGLFHVTCQDRKVNALEVYNALGQWIQTVLPQEGESELSIDLSGHSHGIYVLRVVTGEKTDTYRLVKN